MPTEFHKVTNNAIGYLETSIDSEDLIVELGAGEGSVFPADGPFWISIEDEIMDCSGIDSDTLYLTERGSQDTIAVSHSTGVPVEILISAGQVQELQDSVGSFEALSTDPLFDSIVVGGNSDLSGDVDIGGGYGSGSGSTLDTDGNAFFNGDVAIDGTGFALGISAFTIGATTAGATTLNVGGGYGSTGATISSAGNIQANGNLTIDGTSTLSGNVTAPSIDIGGGYGSTGATIGAAGAFQANGDITTDATLHANAANIGGGYGSSGTTLYSTGNIAANGSLIVDSTAHITGNLTTNGTLAAVTGNFSGRLTPLILNISSGSTTLTVSSGEITVTQSWHDVDTQGAAGTDDLDTINGGTTGDILVLTATNSGRVVTVRDNGVTGSNLRLANDTAYAIGGNSLLVLLKRGSIWVELSRGEA